MDGISAKFKTWRDHIIYQRVTCNIFESLRPNKIVCLFQVTWIFKIGMELPRLENTFILSEVNREMIWPNMEVPKNPLKTLGLVVKK